MLSFEMLIYKGVRNLLWQKIDNTLLEVRKISNAKLLERVYP